MAGPTFQLSAQSDLEWKGINATILPSQLYQQEGQPTWIVGVTMVDVFQDTGFGHSSVGASLIRKRVSLLTWLDTVGHELWRCSEGVGLRLQLCQTASGIVGVDLLGGRWRLWVWNPQQHTALQHVVYLGQNILRAHVLSAKSGDAQNFWLVEESQEGVRISSYVGSSLYEAVSIAWLHGVHLLEPQSGCGSLNWHTEIDAFVIGEKFVLLCTDEEHKLTLYQIG